MSELHNQLNQVVRYIRSGDGTLIEMPYTTNFSFIDSYPYEIKIVPIKQVRIDHLTKIITGTPSGWKILSIFNDMMSPLEFFKKEYLIIPEDFAQAMNWLNRKNIG